MQKQKRARVIDMNSSMFQDEVLIISVDENNFFIAINERNEKIFFEKNQLEFLENENT